MKTLLFLALCTACGTSDPRPPTFDVIASEILAPTCGQVQCHSTTTFQSGYAFDTLEAARTSMKKLTAPDAHETFVGVVFTSGGKRMPPDSPFDDADLQLIQRWVDSAYEGL